MQIRKLSYICTGHLTNTHHVYTFIENIENALRGELVLFNKYLALLDVDDTRVNYKALELPGMPQASIPVPGLIEK